MPDIPNPASVPGILPSEVGPDKDDLPLEADPHFGTDDADDEKNDVGKPASDGVPTRKEQSGN